MRAKTTLLLVAFCGSAVGVPVALQQHREIKSSRAAIASLTQKRQGLETAIRQAQEREALTLLPSSVRRHDGLAASPQKRPTRFAASSHSQSAPPDPVVNDPVLQNLYLAAERANLDALYGPLIRDLGLSSAQLEIFRDHIMKRHEQRMDLCDIQQSHGLSGDDPALVSLERRASDAFKSKLSELLGNAAYQKFDHFERTLPIRQLVDHFAGAVALEGQPLSTVQADDLTHVLAQASPPFVQGGTADPNRVDWSMALDASAAVLSEPQQHLFFNMVPRYPVATSGLETAAGALSPPGGPRTPQG
jgi:hypothetical protein